MIVWVVTGQSGQYSDYDLWVVGIARDLAEAHKKAAQDAASRTEHTQPYKPTRSSRKPAKIVPGVTEVSLGVRPDQWEPIHYSAEAYELPEEAA